MCLDVHAACTQGRCQCTPQYVERFGACVARVDLGQPCLLGLDVCADEHALCEDGFCQCEVSHFAKRGRCGKFTNRKFT